MTGDPLFVVFSLRECCKAHSVSKSLLLSSAALLAAAGSAANAQEAAELPPLVVEGATLEKPKAKVAKPSASQPVSAGVADTAAPVEPTAQVQTVTGIPYDQIGTSVSVVTGAQLKAQQVRTVADALRSLPGVSVNRTGSLAGLTQVTIRGAEANHTLVLIDGVEMNDTTNGEFDFSDLSADGIEQIEVLRGAQSGIYGTGALGGVINIITKGGKGPLTLRASAEGGAFGTHELTARASAGNDNGYFKASVAKREYDGFNVSPLGNEDDGGELSTFSFNAGLAITRDAGVDVVLRHTDKFGERDGFGGIPGQLATAVDDPSTLDTKTWMAGVTLHWDMLDGALSHVVRANNYRNNNVDTDLSFPDFPFVSENDSERTKYGYLVTYRFDTPMMIAAKHSISGLIEEERESFTPSGDLTDNIERKRDRLALVGEYRGEFGGRLFVTGSVRNDDNSDVEDFTSWRTTAALKLPEIGLRPHASTGTGVKLPSFFELYGSLPGFFIPNPNLVPEESFDWDAGVEFSFLRGQAAIDVTYFNADLENEIVGSGFPFSVENLAGKSKREGIEVAARYQLSPALLLGASYTYLDTERPDGLPAIRRPEHSGRADLTYAFAGGKGLFNLTAIYNGDRQDNVFLLPTFAQQRIVVDDYWLLSAAASYAVAPGVELFGRVENLLDEDYQEVYGYETADIAAYAGVRFTFEEPQSRAWAEGR